MHSFHIFYFPFKWKIQGEKRENFSETIDLSNITPLSNSHWITNYAPNIEEQKLLYNEKNYYYKFVHPVLYDDGSKDSLLRHYERDELHKNQSVIYRIKIKKEIEGKDIYCDYQLDVDAINLNFYSTGVGMLSLFVKNTRYSKPEDILNINQYGRRILPPFYDDINIRNEIALSLSLEGLTGEASRYEEDFSKYTPQDIWQPAKFIKNLIKDLQNNLEIVPVIDDRMFINCWFQNNEMATKFYYTDDEVKKLKEHKNYTEIEQMQEQKFETFVEDPFWYKYLYVDAGDNPTCRNHKMRKGLLELSTYPRWQENGSLYGCTKYSLVLLTSQNPFAENVLAIHMRGVYSRMIELLLVQRASMLKFSEEVTRVSRMKGKNDTSTALRIGTLYKEYIRFINQVYFRSVTAQDQGIELYEKLLEQFGSEKQIKDLDSEISELHNYISLLLDDSRNTKATWLNVVATILLPATVITGIFGMNEFPYESWTIFSLVFQFILLLIISLLTYKIVNKKNG